MLYDDIYAITDIDASVSALRMFSASFDISRSLKDVFEIFKQESDLPGVILTRNGIYVDVLFRVKFFELMSQSFMMEIFKNKPIEFFQTEYPTAKKLLLPAYTLIVKAVELVLQRQLEYRDDPVVVETASGEKKLIDVHRLLLAHNHIHMLTMQQLKNANSFKDEMLHIIAHDLKNPINGITGYALMIEECVELETEPRKWVANIQKSSSKMLELIQELLKSASEENSFSLHKSAFSLNKLLNEVVSSHEKDLRHKGQMIVLENKSAYECTINADRLKLYEVFENIISNAVKYSPVNTNITIAIKEGAAGCEVHISDRGPGFSQNDRKHLFKKFQRLSARPTAGESSSGLGLYIVKNIIELHKGNIFVEDREGGGSTFVVVLPETACRP